MDSSRFDALVQTLIAAPSRRRLVVVFASVIVSSFSSSSMHSARKRKKTRKTPFCLAGQTITVASDRKKKKKILKRGATPGECPLSPTGCTPTCSANTCGGNDGCGGTCACAPDALCVAAVCQPCTVTCREAGATCGSALQSRVQSGGTIYVCPGRYQGNFQLDAEVTLIGAGEGADPATNTILDANGNGRVVTVGTGAVVNMSGLHITGGKLAVGNGGGIRNLGTLTLTSCTIHKNKAVDGGGISQALVASGPLTLNSCSITENDGLDGGGLALAGQHSVVLNTCVVSNNKATFGIGGGITTSGCPVNILDTAIIENSSATDAGGIFVFESTLHFNAGSRLMGNTAGNMAGAIFNSQGTVNLNGATVSGNSAPQCIGVAGC